MDQIGVVNDRQILYINIRKDSYWFDKLPYGNWCVFTVADNDDKQLLDGAVVHCMDKNVTYTCIAGQLAGVTELSFDIQITKRTIEEEDKTGLPHDCEQSPITTMHQNFSEGFWFATTVAFDGYRDINKVVCLDFTTKGVKQKITELIQKINSGWLQSDEVIEYPTYDEQL